jgi:hypothetical protein
VYPLKRTLTLWAIVATCELAAIPTQDKFGTFGQTRLNRQTTDRQLAIRQECNQDSSNQWPCHTPAQALLRDYGKIEIECTKTSELIK